MSKKAEVTMTFAVTFRAPQGMSIPVVRDFIRKGLMQQIELGIADNKDVKIHLTNKEVSYGKR